MARAPSLARHERAGRAPLLAILAVRATAEACNDWTWARAQLPALCSIVDAFLRGTHHGIHVDGDGLVCAGERGLQLTWMDAKVGDLVVTPRMGKPVELTGLWIASLEALAMMVADDPRHAAREDELRRFADLATRALGRFWNPATQCFRDVVDGPEDNAGAAAPSGARGGPLIRGVRGGGAHEAGRKENLENTGVAASAVPHRIRRLPQACDGSRIGCA